MRFLKFKSLFFILILLLILFNAYSTQDRANNLLNGNTLSDVIYNISNNIINNQSEIISLNIDSTTAPLIVSFISNDYAILNNITCDDDNCTLFGKYLNRYNTIYILPESINDYYNLSTLNETLLRISNTFTHELIHFYQDEKSLFTEKIIDSLNMNATYIGSIYEYNLYNYADYFNLNLTDVDYPLNNTINFPDALIGYNSNKRAVEIQARIIALCFGEKDNYIYYWDMVEQKNYTLCNNYIFPAYLDNSLASDYQKFIESYFEQYLGINLNLKIEEAGNTYTDAITLIGVLVDSFSYLLQNYILSLSIVSLIILLIYSLIVFIRIKIRKSI